MVSAVEGVGVAIVAVDAVVVGVGVGCCFGEEAAEDEEGCGDGGR